MAINIGLIILLTLTNCTRHPSPYNKIHGLSLVKTYSQEQIVNEDEYGHFSLCDALNHDFSQHCDDVEYSNWVRSELIEWHRLLSKSSEKLDEAYVKVNKVQKQLETVCANFPNLTEFRGNLNPAGLGENDKCSADVYTFETSCLMQLIDNIGSEELINEQKQEELCRHILKQTDNLHTQILWLKQNHKNFNVWKGKVLNRSTQVCCNTTCLKCNGPAEDDCTVCPATREHPLNQPDSAENYTCKCKDGFYEASTDDNKKQKNCLECENKCKTCKTSADNCIDCADEWVKKDGKCKCPTKHTPVKDSDGKWECKPCHYSCLECSGVQANQCSILPEGEDKSCPKNREYDNGECKPKPGYYDKEPEPEGQKCHYTCQLCEGEGPQACSKCDESLGREQIIINDPLGECNCTANKQFKEGEQIYYRGLAKADQPQCEKCYPSCVTCSGTAYNQCTGDKCPANKEYKKISDNPHKAECVPKPGYFCDHCPSTNPPGAKEPGVPCDNTCKTCQNGGKDGCKSCHGDGSTFNFVQNGDTGTGKCECDTNKYFDEVNKTCKECHFSCGTCIGKESTECLNCDSENRTFRENENATDSTGTCPPNPGKYECDKKKEPCDCDPICKTCTESGKCTSCKNEPNRESTTDGQCICKDGSRNKHYNNKTSEGADNFECTACDDTEKTCETKPGGPSAKECKENRIIHVENGLNKCVCPVDNYSDQGSVKCYPCDEECKSCETENVCTECKSETREQYEGACPCKAQDGHQYFSNDQGKCQKCHNACKTCLGALSSDCVIPTDPNTHPIGHNDVKDVHYIFIIESSKNMDASYDRLSEDGTVNNNLFPQFETKYELAQHAVEEFIIEKIKQEKETGITDDVSLINFSKLPTETYWGREFKKEQIESFPNDTTEDTSSNLQKALNTATSKIQPQDKNKHIYHIIIIVDGDQPFDADKYNEFTTRIKDKTQTFKIIQLQSKHTETPGKIVTTLKPNIPGTSTKNPEKPEEFVEEVPETIVPPSTGTPECIHGYFLDKEKFETEPIYCLECPKTCKTCESVAKCNTCVDNSNREVKEGKCECKEGFEEYNNEVTCKEKCKEAEYRDDKGECQPCNPKCKHCSGPSENQCTSCNAGEYLDNSSCKPCKNECKSCENGTTCKECKNGEAKTFKRILKNNQCVCDEGHREAKDTSDLQCLKNCEDNEFQRDALDCAPCDLTCSKCYSQKDHCTECYETTQHREHDGQSNTCKCKDKYFESQDTSNNVCSECSENCETCEETADNCTSCTQNMTKITTGEKPHKCECNPKHYGVVESEVLVQCLPCDETCAECSAAQVDKCTACDIGKNREADGTGSEFKCKCMDGYSDYDQDKKCDKCHHSCKTCKNVNDTGCIDCQENRQKQSDGKCPPAPGFYECQEDGQPKPEACPCHRECEECKDNNKNDNCTVCDADKFYQRELPDQETSECEAVPGKYKPQPPTDPNKPFPPAPKCDITCLTCKGSATHCITCDGSKNREIQSNKCPCKEKHFDVLTNRPQCDKCDPTCLTCDGTEDHDCLTCDSEIQKRIEDSTTEGKKCICPDGTYEDDDHTCKPCSYKCNKCTKDKCTECSDDLRELDECNPCENCYEKVPGKPEVGKCHYTCATCKGPLASDCLSCYQDTEFNREDLVKKNTTDTSGECPCAERYFDPGNLTCKKCHVTCLTCTSDDRDQCTSCDETKFEKLTGNKGQCFPKCGYYYTPADGVAKCSCQCKCCNQGGIEGCTDGCQDNATLQGGKCVAIAGYYRQSCDILKCNDECSTCKYDAGKQVCTACNNTGVTDTDLQKNLNTDGKCVCGSGYFENTEKKCQVCDNKCSTCVKEGECTRCKGAFTKNETCECLDDYIQEDNGIGCKEKTPGQSVEIVIPGIIVGEGDNADGSVQVDPNATDAEICVKTVRYIVGDHEGEEDEPNASAEVVKNNSSASLGTTTTSS